jgi:hypothetical protein
MEAVPPDNIIVPFVGDKPGDSVVSFINSVESVFKGPLVLN